MWLFPSVTKERTWRRRRWGEVLVVQKRVLGEEHPHTLSNLALSLFNQGMFAEADEMERHVLAEQKRVLGEEHPRNTFENSCGPASCSQNHYPTALRH